MTASNSGFLTLAFGRRYAEMAVDMALSLKEYHSEPVSIAVDTPARQYLARYEPSPFEQVICLPQKVHAWGAKFLVAEVSPYQDTIYVDADILFFRSVQELFQRDYGAPLAVLGEFLAPDQDRTHQGFSTAAICADFGLSRYLKTNSGMFVFKRDRARRIFSDCYNFYVSGIKKYPRYAHGIVPDELVLGIIGAAHSIACIGLPRPMPWGNEIPLMTPSDPQWPLVHMIGRPSDEFLEYLLGEVARRRRAACFPVTSETIWRQKAHPTPSFWKKVVHRCKTLVRKAQKFR